MTALRWPRGCSHKTAADHSRMSHTHRAEGLTVAGKPVRVWTCSDCKREGPWSKSWAYYGALECRECDRTVIDHVSCGCKPQKGRR